MIAHKNHFSRYCELMTLVASSSPSRQHDGGYMAALYILSADNELYELTLPQVSSNGISFEKLHQSILQVGLTDSQIIAAKTAHSLFNSGSCTVSPFDLAQCDYSTLDIITNALYIWKCGRIPSGGDDGQIQFDTTAEQRFRSIEAGISTIFASMQVAG